jgi:hypothetical protein
MTDLTLDILRDDLASLQNKGPAFVTFGEVMVRDTPADDERLERTHLVHLSMAGSEYTVAIGLSRFGIPSAFITRIPANPCRGADHPLQCQYRTTPLGISGHGR